METRLLRYFVAVAEELHFGRASERVGIAQPPLSQQIQKLEKELGVQLFQRTSRRVELTDVGKWLLGEASLILNRIEAVRDVANRFAEGMNGRLDVGAVSPALDTFLPTLIQRFGKSHPNIHLSLHELRSDDQIEWLRTGRLDVGFVRVFGQDLEGLEHRVVRRERYILALPANHTLAKKKIVPLASLQGVGIIMAPRRSRPALHDRILSCFEAAGASVNVVQEASSKRTEIALVAAGIGLALVPAPYALVFKRKGVAYRPIRGELPSIEMAAIWRSEHLSRPCSRFLSQLDD